MANKKFPQDFPDITATSNKVLAANPDGTNGTVNIPVGGETLQTVTARQSTTDRTISVRNSTNDSSIIINSDVYSSPYVQAANFPQTTAKNLLLNPNGGNVGVKKSTAAEALDVEGNIKASGSVSGTVFNPTSLRSRKRDIKDYKGDALAAINSLQLHTYHFKEYEQVEKTPAVYDGDNLITSAEYKQVEITPVNQMLNVGVILDEVENPLVADQERGVLNLNNIVFLQAKAIQQLTARLEVLESK